MKKTLILVGFLALTPFAKGQLLLEALEGGTSSIKCLERVKDKHYGDGVHNYIYCAVQGPNGKKWLNLNLGAEYAKESSPHFNPEALPTDYNDWKAFGNLYQWGRGSDGHEQVEYREGSEYWEIKPINGVRSTRLAAGEQSNQMVTDPTSNVYAYNLGESWINNPCPNGYHIATMSDIMGLTKLDIIKGDLNTTSLFGNSRFPDLLVMTSPNLTVVANPGGYERSSAYVNEPKMGTSALWLGGGDKLYWYDEDWVKPENDMTGNLRWLDRGYFLTNHPTLGNKTYNYGTNADVVNKDQWYYAGTNLVPNANAIRCVQD